MTGALVRFQEVTLGYGRRTVLQGLDFTLREGDYLGLVGPNGSGKTTILRAIVGSLRPRCGSLWRREGLRFGYVPQREQVDEIFPFTAREVVMMGRTARIGLIRRPGRQDREAAEACLARVGLGNLSATLFRELSGGQKQRVLLARALAGDPEVLLLDEPTAGMDLASEADTLALIDGLHREGLTVVLVSHQLELVAGHVQRVGILHGRLVVGPVGEVLTGERLSAIYGRPVEVRKGMVRCPTP